MHKTFRKLIGVLVLAGALVPVILIAAPSAQAATVCDVANPCLPQGVGFSSTINGGAASFQCSNQGYASCLHGGVSNGTADGVDGASAGGNGVYGSSNADSTERGGVYGADSFGFQSVGVKGVSYSGYGGYFTAPGAAGWGIHASGGGRGVDASGVTGPGVVGTTSSTATNGAGVFGTINSSADYSAGIRGQNLNASCCGFGVVGFHAGQGIGIGGYAPNGFGVFGWSPNNWAAWLDGAVQVTKDLHVSGTLFKGAGAFRIDNPLDPAHSYLQHSFVESPDMKNIYDGNVTTNAKGYATVQLPKWFQALNKDFRYQLTILGHSPWDTQARVWNEITNNRFTIRTNHGNVKVSWQVTGIRHDRYANAHRIQAVVPKTGADAGKYEHPRLFGQPASKGVTALPAQLRHAKQAAAAPKAKTK
jgi:hypothetical protein